MLADATLTCQLQILNVHIIFNFKTHQNQYEAYCIWNRSPAILCFLNINNVKKSKGFYLSKAFYNLRYNLLDSSNPNHAEKVLKVWVGFWMVRPAFLFLFFFLLHHPPVSHLYIKREFPESQNFTSLVNRLKCTFSVWHLRFCANGNIFSPFLEDLVLKLRNWWQEKKLYFVSHGRICQMVNDTECLISRLPFSD